jgi:hypothetical protein
VATIRYIPYIPTLATGPPRWREFLNYKSNTLSQMSRPITLRHHLLASVEYQSGVWPHSDFKPQFGHLDLLSLAVYVYVCLIHNCKCVA